jgi:thiol-disulfide isomerase/thioredoxin
VLPSGAALPSFEGATRWLHGEVTPDSLRGAPVLVQFWAVSCPLCKDHLPTLRAWKERFGPRGVQFVSVHMPRQESDTRIEAVVEAVEQGGMDEAVAIDNEHAIGDRFETGGIWPMYFLFDAAGKLRARAAGVAGLAPLERTLERLIVSDGR